MPVKPNPFALIVSDVIPVPDNVNVLAAAPPPHEPRLSPTLPTDVEPTKASADHCGVVDRFAGVAMRSKLMLFKDVAKFIVNDTGTAPPPS